MAAGVLLTFAFYCLLRLGVHPLARYRRLNPTASPTKVARFVQANGLNDGLGGYISGYFSWLSHFAGFSGGWSPSIKREVAVWPELRSALFNSLRLLILATVLGAGGGYLLDALARKYNHKPVQQYIDRGGIIAASVPVFVTAVAVQLVFAVKWGRLPTAGLYPVGQSGFDLKQMVRHLLLPTVVLALHNVFWYAHQFRALRSHTMRTLMAALIGSRAWILGSLVVTETVFAYPGVGRFFLVAVQNGDFPQLMPTAALLVLSLLILHALFSPASAVVASEDSPAAAPPDLMHTSQVFGPRWTRITITVLAALALIAALAPWTARYGAREAVRNLQVGPNQNLSPRAISWFGSNSAGYDVYSQMFFAFRSTLFAGLVASAVAVALGVAAAAILRRRRTSASTPSGGIGGFWRVLPLVTALLVVRNVLSGPGWLNPILGQSSSLRLTIVVVALVSAAYATALFKRHSLLDLSGFRAVARSDRRTLGTVIASTLAFAILCESTLSFLGFGPELGSTSATLGTLIGQSRSAALERQWWVFAFPAGLLVFVLLGLGVIRAGLGDGPESSALVIERITIDEAVQLAGETNIEVTA